MHPRFTIMLAAVTALSACDHTPASEASSPYPDLTTPVSCATHPHLCGADRTDLGGGDHPRAFHLVFVGDGFSATELPRFRGAVDAWVSALQTIPASPAVVDPALFHFWRVDLVGADESVDDDVRTDTPLGAYPRTDSCCAFIDVDIARGALAVAASVGAPDEPVQPNVAQGVVIHVTDGLAHGRANGGSVVNISVHHDARTLLHELGHALFHLADEYVDFTHCGDDTVAVELHDDDVDLIGRANVNRSGAIEKWAGLSDESVVGAHRSPCHHKSDDACIMGSVGDAFCAVCARELDDIMARRRCDADIHPPRVIGEATLLPGGSRVAVVAVADDTRDGDLSLAFDLDGAPIEHDGAIAVVDLALLAEHPGETAPGLVSITATDAAGNVGRAPVIDVRALLPAPPVVSGDASLSDGRIVLFVSSAVAGGVTAALEAASADAAPSAVATHVAGTVATVFVRPAERTARARTVRLRATSVDGRVLSGETTHTVDYAPPPPAPMRVTVRTSSLAASDVAIVERTAPTTGALFIVDGGAPRAIGAVLRKRRDDVAGADVQREVSAQECPSNGSCRLLLPLTLAPRTLPSLTFFVVDAQGVRRNLEGPWQPIVDDEGTSLSADIAGALNDVRGLEVAQSKVSAPDVSLLSLDVLFGDDSGVRATREGFVGLRYVPGALHHDVAVLVTALARTTNADGAPGEVYSLSRLFTLPAVTADVTRPVLVGPRTDTRGVVARAVLADLGDAVRFVDRDAVDDESDSEKLRSDAAGHVAAPLPRPAPAATHDSLPVCEVQP